MERYISILRGINVSGKNLIKMTALKSSMENLGFLNVTTYVQSGNIIFSAKKTSVIDLEKIIQQQIKVDFGFEIPIIVLTIKNLEEIIANNPFLKDPKKDDSFFHVSFLSCNPTKIDMQEIEIKKLENEEIIFGSKVFYLYCPHGYGNTKLNNNFLEKKLKVNVTTRNWRTTNELLKIAKTPSDKK